MSFATIDRPRTIDRTFQELRRSRRIGLVPFLPAGYPDITTTAPAIKAVDAAGAAVIEVGFPFSDPVADGPVIQEAFTAALARKLKVSQIFAAVQPLAGTLAAPLVAMVSMSVVYRYGTERFLIDAKQAGFSGIIIPDLPPPEAQDTCRQIRAVELDTILLVAPTTPPQRRREIAGLCSGFVYYLSVSGTTGERDALPPDLADGVRQMRQMTQRPVCVGFGIHRAEHLRALTGVADGAIVGTAMVRKIKDAAAGGSQAIAHSLDSYCRELLS